MGPVTARRFGEESVDVGEVALSRTTLTTAPTRSPTQPGTGEEKPAA